MKQSNIERFMSKVHKTDGCWEWQGTIYPTGYGQFHINGANRRAHRVAYELFCGTIGNGLLVCHTCDNRACVRPDHLWLGTVGDNTRDMHAKRRAGKWVKPDRLRTQSKLNWQLVKSIRQEFAGGTTTRELAEKYSISVRTVRKAITEKWWQKEDDVPVKRIPNGRLVTWTSQASGLLKTKTGTLVAFIPKGVSVWELPEVKAIHISPRNFRQAVSKFDRYLVNVPQPRKRQPTGPMYYTPLAVSVQETCP